MARMAPSSDYAQPSNNELRGEGVEFCPSSDYAQPSNNAAWMPLYPRQARKGLVEFAWQTPGSKTGMDAGF
jgi:hypothetical protein